MALLNLFVGVLVNTFADIRAVEEGHYLLSESQKQVSDTTLTLCSLCPLLSRLLLAQATAGSKRTARSSRVLSHCAPTVSSYVLPNLPQSAVGRDDGDDAGPETHSSH